MHEDPNLYSRVPYNLSYVPLPANAIDVSIVCMIHMELVALRLCFLNGLDVEVAFSSLLITMSVISLYSALFGLVHYELYNMDTWASPDN